MATNKGLMGGDWSSSTATLLVLGPCFSKHWSIKHLGWCLLGNNCSDEEDQSLTLAYSNLKVHTSVKFTSVYQKLLCFNSLDPSQVVSVKKTWNIITNSALHISGTCSLTLHLANRDLENMEDLLWL